MNIFKIVQILMAFMIGSIPFGILVCHGFGLLSPKTYGSGNIGASNVARQNLLAGAVTLVLDAAKGFLALKLLASTDIILLAVVLGHCYSPFMNFSGGKGVATAMGALIASHPPIAALLLMLWGTVFARNRTPAIASIACAVMLALYAAADTNLALFIASVLVIIRHKSNVEALHKSA